MSASNAPQTVVLFDPRNPARTREVSKAEAKRWEKQGWTSTEPKAPEQADKS